MLEVGFSIATQFILPSEVHLVGFLFFAAGKGALELSGIHFVLVSVGGVDSIGERWRQLILNVLI